MRISPLLNITDYLRSQDFEGISLELWAAVDAASEAEDRLSVVVVDTLHQLSFAHLKQVSNLVAISNDDELFGRHVGVAQLSSVEVVEELFKDVSRDVLDLLLRCGGLLEASDEHSLEDR